MTILKYGIHVDMNLAAITSMGCSPLGCKTADQLSTVAVMAGEAG